METAYQKSRGMKGGGKPVTGYPTRVLRVPIPIFETLEEERDKHKNEIRGNGKKMSLTEAIWICWGANYNPKQEELITPIELAALKAQVRYQTVQLQMQLTQLEISQKEIKELKAELADANAQPDMSAVSDWESRALKAETKLEYSRKSWEKLQKKMDTGKWQTTAGRNAMLQLANATLKELK